VAWHETVDHCDWRSLGDRPDVGTGPAENIGFIGDDPGGLVVQVETALDLGWQFDRIHWRCGRSVRDGDGKDLRLFLAFGNDQRKNQSWPVFPAFLEATPLFVSP
jgi:hypothetical protein